MLEKPSIQNEKIGACLLQAYGLHAATVEFLPLGADQNAAVYRILGGDGGAYFLKLRAGDFDEIAVLLPRYLADQGINCLIAPLSARDGQLWAQIEPYKTILYPFVEGRNGFKARLTEQHWRSFGQGLKRIHAVALPDWLKNRIPQEAYSAHWREMVRGFLRQAEEGVFGEPVALKTAALLRGKRAEILELICRADGLAHSLSSQPPPTVLCHSDLHAGNILIGSDDAFYIVDWDAPILAPKERDLMYIGGGQGFLGSTPQEEATCFYRGYGMTAVNEAAIAYYRYERIIEDIAAFCEQLLLSEAGGSDREQSYGYLASNFDAGGTLEIARRFDKA